MEEIKSDKITRVEVIDHSGLGGGQGRILVEYFQGPVKVEYDLQDDGKTLKIFLSNKDLAS